MRVYELREFGEDFHNLVRTLAACCHDDDVGISLLGDGVLKNCLSAAERSRDKSGTAFGNRVEGIDDSYSGLHDTVRTRFLLVSLDCNFDRPFLGHGDRNLSAFLVDKGSDDGIYII